MYERVDDRGNVSYPIFEADILQVAHHAINDWLDNVYANVHPTYLFVPTADISLREIAGSRFANTVEQFRREGVQDCNIFYQNRKTHWLTLNMDGSATHGEQDITGYDEGYWYYVDGNIIKDSTGENGAAVGGTAQYHKGYLDYINKYEPFYTPN